MCNVEIFNGEVALAVASNTINRQKTRGMEQGSRGRNLYADYEFAKNVGD